MPYTSTRTATEIAIAQKHTYSEQKEVQKKKKTFSFPREWLDRKTYWGKEKLLTDLRSFFLLHLDNVQLH